MEPPVRTLDGSLSFQRPTNVYKEMYSIKLANRSGSIKRVGLLAAIGISVAVITLLGFALQNLEQTMQEQHMGAAEQGIVATVLKTVLGVQTVHAAEFPELASRDDNYRAVYVGQSHPDPIQMTVGETKTVTIRFKNTGTTTWQPHGSRFISAFTIEPKYRDSIFMDSDQTDAILRATGPGEIAELPVTLTATAPGEYKEQFQLAAYNHTWMKGGYFYLIVHVSPGTEEVTGTPEQEDVAVVDEPAPVEEIVPVYKARRVVLSRKEVTARGGSSVRVITRFRNFGTKTWSTYGLVANSPTKLAASNRTLTFADTSWKSQSHVVNYAESVEPGELAEAVFTFRAPVEPGNYTARFYLQVDGKLMPDVSADVVVNVTSAAPKSYRTPQLPPDPTAFAKRVLVDEPDIRIGLWQADGDVEFVGTNGDYIVYNGDKEMGTLTQGELGTLSRAGSVSSFKSDEVSFHTNGIIRLLPENGDETVFEIQNFERTVPWFKDNFNQYRGAIEYRPGKTDGKMWVVNVVGLEHYVAGVSETGNLTPFEYQKALQTAARTYAYTIIQCKCKYGIFDVVPSTADQLFLGYKSEVFKPNLVKAQQETAGYLVTYDLDDNPVTPNDVVITPYFSNTSGQTLSWSEVWGGSDKPWLQPVEAHYDARDGKKLWGHGVGMSNYDAIVRARETDITWIELLQHYYTDVEVEQVY